MKDFTYHAPVSLADALTLKANESGVVRFLAGGTDLLLAMERAKPPIEAVIDLKGVAELAGIQPQSDGTTLLGALTPMADIEADPHLRARYPALAEAAAAVGGPPIRNRATLGGNLCNASPAADTATPLVALAAQAVIVSTAGERALPLLEFWRGPGSNALAAGELLKGVRLPALPARTACAFHRLTRAAMDIALVNAAAVVTVDDAGRVTQAACALGAVGPTVLAVTGLAEALHGKPCDDDALALVKAKAAAAARPIDDKRASADYRREMAGLMAARAVRQAYERALAAAGGKR